MQTRLMHLYGLNKLPSEREEKKAQSYAEGHKKVLRSRSKQPPKYRVGMRFGLLKLVGRALKKGYFGPLHRGKWVCLCVCGREIEVGYWKLAQGLAYSCGCKKRPRKQPKQTRPPNQRKGDRVGRLKVGDYMTNRGWDCLCVKCGEREWVRYSRDLGRAGRRACAN